MTATKQVQVILMKITIFPFDMTVQNIQETCVLPITQPVEAVK